MIDWKPIMDALPDNDREVLCMLKDYPDPVMGYFLDGKWITDIPDAEVISWCETPPRYKEKGLSFRSAWEAYHIASKIKATGEAAEDDFKTMFYHVRGRIYNATTDGLFSIVINYPPREDIVQMLREKGFRVETYDTKFNISWLNPKDQPRIHD